ncbi:hypothetical protein D0T51_05515 [Parabacteroides sp. 52]|uniref:restriction endonuclease subunit S n=1 Tax=unclassified Parabacteroides TaxID=2649774 RepID=UPI0013D7DD7C|nr:MULTISPECIES: restriction endonuclease subunit S [unclassified Parabacteroides]MDH6534579.1 type I restriction enzyme S subunit [Parabacteroides sp. PM5-20]NDV55187.1 hypothetical protein [Parabacteroides sp. 52]
MAKQYFIKDFLKRIKRPIVLKDNEEYKLVTVKMNHKGVVLREKKKGCEIKSNMYIVKEGDFILSGIDARNGAFGIVPFELDGAVVTNDFWYFDLDENIILKELFLQMTSTVWFDEICKKGSDGTTQRIRLQKDKFFNQKIWLPEKTEQKIILEHILNFKTKLECVSIQNIIQNEQAKLLKQSILQDAIQGKLTAEWREQNPDVEAANELLKRIKAEKEKLIKEKKIKKEKPLPPIKEEEVPFDLPDGWVWCRLGEVFSTTSGGTPNRANSKYWKGDVIWYKSGELNDNILDDNSEEFITNLGLQESSATLFPHGTLLIAMYGATAGKLAILNRKAATNQAICGFFENKGVKTKYLFYYLMANRSKMIEDSWGMSQPNISQTYLRNFIFVLPSLVEQQVIVEKVETFMKKCNQLSEEIDNLNKHSQDLLKALFNETFDLREAKQENEFSVKTEPTKKHKPKEKTVALKPTNVDYYKRSVLAAEIVWQLHKEPTLGHLKLQKLIFLCQKTANMQLPTNFLRQAMGPYDNQLMRSIDKQLKLHKWFEYKGAESLKYQPLEKVGTHSSDYLKYFSSESASIQYIIDTFKQAKSSSVEIVATLYACMENILAENNVIYSETLLLQRFYEWSEEKQKFTENEVKVVLKRMKDLGIIPEGLKNIN